MHSRDPVTSDRAQEESLLTLAQKNQPNTVHEIADRLLSAYTVDGGTVRLAGCLLEDCLFLRGAARGTDPSVELFLDCDGKEVAPAMIETLGMRDTIELPRPPEQATRRETGGEPAPRRWWAGRGSVASWPECS